MATTDMGSVQESLKTEHEYEDALARIDKIMDAEPGTPEMDELKRLVRVVEIYEDEHYPMGTL